MTFHSEILRSTVLIFGLWGTDTVPSSSCSPSLCILSLRARSLILSIKLLIPGHWDRSLLFPFRMSLFFLAPCRLSFIKYWYRKDLPWPFLVASWSTWQVHNDSIARRFLWWYHNSKKKLIWCLEIAFVCWDPCAFKADERNQIWIFGIPKTEGLEIWAATAQSTLGTI